MDTLIVTLQLLLLLPALPLAVMSQRTSRAHRERHSGYVAVAALLGLAAGMLALLSLAIVLGSEEPVDMAMSFAPPVLTLLACGWVARRGMTAGVRAVRR
jgi:hypothetical protein